MRSKLALALMLFGTFVVTTASMPQTVRPLSQDAPLCDCIVYTSDETYLVGVYDKELDACVIGEECIIIDD